MAYSDCGSSGHYMPVWHCRGRTHMKVLPDIHANIKPFKRNQDQINEAAKEVWSLVRECNDNHFTALVSFVLTTTKGTLARSVLIRLFNDGDIIGASRQFTKFTKRNGKHSRSLLILRRRQCKLFLRPVIVASNEVKRG